jgi:hypothetical protein
VPSLSPPRYPNWTIDSTISSVESTPDPDYESSRPSTSRSTQTSSSLFSRLSHMSEDEQCSSPHLDRDDKFVLLDDLVNNSNNARGGLRLRTKSRKAPWTKAMSTHLWSTYVLYLEDPKVTPFRMEKSCIPPPGVCMRVAREARRSWKGSKALERAANPRDGEKSGSSTPTGESTSAYMAWPHTCAATRAHLRELCKLKAASGSRGMQFLSRSPTPFSQAAARHWNRRSTPGRSSGFAADLSMSLAISTSDTMHPHGPLAQLTGSTAEAPVEQMLSPPEPSLMLGTFDGEPSFAERRRLGSPFSAARSYGPSSSNALAAAFDYTPMPRRQSNTMGGHRHNLQSPVRLSRSSTQKRRHTQSNVPRKRPGLGSDIWLDPSAGSDAHTEATPATEASMTMWTRLDTRNGPPLPTHPLLSTSSSMPDVGGQSELSVAAPPPPRLGSPFSGTSSSFSFPRRAHRQHPGSVDLGMLGRPYATFQFQQAPQPEAGLTRAGLTDRLSYIDQRLKELRNRDPRRRSQSPL